MIALKNDNADVLVEAGKTQNRSMASGNSPLGDFDMTSFHQIDGALTTLDMRKLQNYSRNLKDWPDLLSTAESS